LKKLTFLSAVLVLTGLGQLLGCANVIEGSAQKRIQLGPVERTVSPPDYGLHLTDDGTFEGEDRTPVLVRATVQIRVTSTTTTTTRTPRTEERVQLILPYSPFREALEFLSSPVYLLWAIPTWSWDQWFAMLNPALNSESMWKGSRVEQVTDVDPIAALVDVESRTERVGAPVEIQLDTLPTLHIPVAAVGEDTEVDVVDLLTAYVFAPPTTLRARMSMEGQDETVMSTLGIEPGLGQRLFRAQRYLLDPSSGRHTPTEIAAAVLRLSELGFEKRSSSLWLSASLIFGTETMSRKTASQHISIAESQKIDGDWATALENIGAARALDRRVQGDWDQLEADVLEKSALESLGAGEYDRARSGLLKAAALDPTRQPRLAPFVTMSIEASDRARERHDTQWSREAFLAIERDRADAEAALAGSNAARLPAATAAVGMGPSGNRAD